MDIPCAVIVACLSLQASLDPPASPAGSIEYNEHSTLTEYVGATSYVENNTDVAALVAPANKPIERYWMEDPVDTVASIVRYDVRTARPPRRTATPMRINSAKTVSRVRGDVRTTAAIPARAIKPAGAGFRVPDKIVHQVRATDWW
jgi:hypothetical protein